jgi:hypothetical protein
MIKFDSPLCFSHHRSGWDYCKTAFNAIHTDNNRMLGFNYLDGVIGKEEQIPCNCFWIGFLHNAIEHPKYYFNLYDFNNSKNGANVELSKLKNYPLFVNSLSSCLGIFTLCNYTKDYLKKHFENINIDVLYHPTETPSHKFTIQFFSKNKNKKVLTIGHWMRNFQTTYDLNSPYKKYIIDVAGVVDKIPLVKNDSVKIIRKRLGNEDYDEQLSKNIVFLDLYDVAACNTIIECIVRNTPVITRRLPANVEYLGEDYPLFFDNLDQANRILADEELIIEGHKYLCKMNKDKFDLSYFQKSFLDSEIIKKVKKKYCVL